MARTKLTERAVTGARATEKEVILWDTEVPGLGLRVRPSGAKSWIVKRGKRWTLGSAGSISLADARKLAQRSSADIAEGKAPTVGLAATKAARAAQATVADLIERYLTDHAKARCAPSTKALYERTARNHIIPRIGHLRLDRIGHGDVDSLIAGLSDSKPTANLSFAILRAAFAKGLRWGMRPKELGNPCEGAEQYALQGKGHHLTADELRVLLSVMAPMLGDGEDRSPAAVLLLLAATGCRRDEIRTLRWEWIDWTEGRVRWPSTKTGAGELLLTVHALRMLGELHREAGMPSHGVAFPGPRPDQPVGRDAVYRRWDAIKRRAVTMGLPAERIMPARPHDLRHSFASIALSAGMGLDDVRRLLRHKDRRSTERYAQFQPHAERAIAARAGEVVPALPSPAVG